MAFIVHSIFFHTFTDSSVVHFALRPFATVKCLHVLNRTVSHKWETCWNAHKFSSQSTATKPSIAANCTQLRSKCERNSKHHSHNFANRVFGLTFQSGLAVANVLQRHRHQRQRRYCFYL